MALIYHERRRVASAGAKSDDGGPSRAFGTGRALVHAWRMSLSANRPPPRVRRDMRMLTIGSRKMSAQTHLFRCLSDNFGVLIHDPASGATASIDAPEAGPVETALRTTGWKLTDILVRS